MTAPVLRLPHVRTRYATPYACLLLVAAVTPVALAAQGADRPRAVQVPVSPAPGTDGAVEELRRYHFAQDFVGGLDAGERHLASGTASPELRAWHLLNLARAGRAEQALAEAGRLRAADSTSPWGWFATAMAANYARGRGAEALQASEAAYRLAPTHPDVLWLRAQTLSSQGKQVEAIALLDSAAARGQLTPQHLVVKANAVHARAYDKGKFIPERADSALAIYAEVRRLDPTNLNGHFLAANRLVNARRAPEAAPLLERALELSPYSMSVNRDHWRAIIARPDLSPEAKQALVVPAAERLLAARGTHASILGGVATVLGDLELKDRQRALEDRVLAEHADSPEADWVYVNRYRALRAEIADTLVPDTSSRPAQRAEYRRLLREFATRPKTHQPTLRGDAYRQLFYEYRSDSTVSPEELLAVVEGMVKYEGINPHIVFGQGAIVLAERTRYFREAERIARMGLDSGKVRIDGQKEIYESVGEHADALDRMSANFHDALGWVFFHEGRLDDAEKQLLHAADLAPNNRDVQYHLGRLYERKGTLDLAEERYVKGAMLQGLGTNPSTAALKALYERQHGSLEGYEAYAASLEERDRARRHEKVLAERAASPEPVRPFTLRTLEGAEVTSASLRGKVVVVNHWGVWCGPCVAEMPEFQKLAKRYADDTSVVVLTINNDADPNSVRTWMQKRGYEFPVLLDDGYANKASVTTYPTTWFIDRDGRIAFTKAGWSEKLEEEFAWRIEVLKP